MVLHPLQCQAVLKGLLHITYSLTNTSAHPGNTSRPDCHSPYSMVCYPPFFTDTWCLVNTPPPASAPIIHVPHQTCEKVSIMCLICVPLCTKVCSWVPTLLLGHCGPQMSDLLSMSGAYHVSGCRTPCSLLHSIISHMPYNVLALRPGSSTHLVGTYHWLVNLYV